MSTSKKGTTKEQRNKKSGKTTTSKDKKLIKEKKINLRTTLNYLFNSIFILLLFSMSFLTEISFVLIMLIIIIFPLVLNIIGFLESLKEYRELDC